jgi:hypothetical protein
MRFASCFIVYARAMQVAIASKRWSEAALRYRKRLGGTAWSAKIPQEASA